MARRTHMTNRFPQIIAELNPKVEAALDAGRHAIATEAKGRVPVDSGDLRDAIHVEDEHVVGGDRDAFYGHFVEFGTSKKPARPFLVPAAEARREEIAAAVTAALRSL